MARAWPEEPCASLIRLELALVTGLADKAGRPCLHARIDIVGHLNRSRISIGGFELDIEELPILRSAIHLGQHEGNQR
jgi:hypothetical protein